MLRLGPGDDAAILRLGQRSEAVVTVDLLTDGVDFRLSEIDPRRAGRKALAVSLSDIAAMAARPTAAVVAVALPEQNGRELGEQLFLGMLPLAEQFGVAIAGGDTNSWAAPLVISVTVIGEVAGEEPLCRSGARPGDKIVVTGDFGGSILGKHLDFTPRVDESLLLSQRYRLHGGMDVSDGLSLDLSRMATASGVGACVELDAVPVSRAARELAARANDGSSALEHALGDGEDFELLMAVPPDDAQRMIAEQPLDVSLTIVGEFVDEQGLWQLDSQGNRQTLAPRGYEHRLD